MKVEKVSPLCVIWGVSMCRWFANRAEVLTSHVRQKIVVFHMNLFDISSRPTQQQHLICAQAGEQKQLNHLEKKHHRMFIVAMVSRIFVYIICLVSSLLEK